ncbi:ATP-binding protein [Nocardioides sp. CER19]|uniref:ATP-binding protein n=1 Tax=Nocardioides sp. CER19 TaxID=3038538 RepID=UPI00244B8B32|nr:ATP-binding protein [Nocardioides sp. CER19]MDH2414597.1 ATP-binding protein [Nocardioides sp. CER19]
MELRRAGWMLAAEIDSIPLARRLVASRLRELPAPSLDIVLVLTSELVTNAVRHGAGPVELRLTWGAGPVRVEVQDQSAERPVLRRVDREATSGRGLVLVDALSGSWGVEQAGAGKTVWFTLDR